MNQQIAQALADRFTPLQQSGLITTLAGLVRPITADAPTAGKKMVGLVAPLAMDSRNPDDWKVLLPDPEKSGIVYFEEGRSQQRSINGLLQVRTSLLLVGWFNGNRTQGLTRDELTLALLSALPGAGRSIPTNRPGIAQLQLSGWSNETADPFLKYSAYGNLFNFKASPYVWLAINLTLTAYVNPACIGNAAISAD